MKRILKTLLIAGLLLLCALWRISFHYWQTPWQVAQAEVPVQSFDSKRLGETPALFWLSEPTRLLLIHRDQYNRIKRNEGTDAAVWVINVETGQTEWHRYKELPSEYFERSHSVNDALPLTLPSGERLSERTVLIPMWELNLDFNFGGGIVPFANPWLSPEVELNKTYAGSVSLIIRQGRFGRVIIKVSRSVFNISRANLPDIERLIELSPDKKYVIFNTARWPYSEGRVLVIGPFGD